MRRVIAYNFIICVLSLVVSIRTLWAEDGNQRESCRAFVQRFYDWYVPKALGKHNGPASDLALKYKREVFSAELLQALDDDSKASQMAKGDIVGLDFDPFFNAQGPWDRYAIGTVTLDGNTCRAEVYGIWGGLRRKKPSVTADMTMKSGRWVFVNFRYGDTDSTYDAVQNDDLLDVLKSFGQDRHH